MIRTVLVDDEADSVNVLRRLLESVTDDIAIVGTAEGVESATTLIRSLDPDLVFLDIEMIEGNAFDLLNRLQPLSFQVIFVTAFDDYALRAFKYSAVDYLLKPIDIDELRAAVDKVRRSRSKVDMSRIHVLLENMGNLQISQQKLAVPTTEGLQFIAVSSIIRMEAKGNYTELFCDGGERFLAAKTIREYEELLPDSIFFRTHNSHIINLQKIRKYLKGRGGFVTMEDGASVEIATRRREEFLGKLLK